MKVKIYCDDQQWYSLLREVTDSNPYCIGAYLNESGIRKYKDTEKRFPDGFVTKEYWSVCSDPVNRPAGSHLTFTGNSFLFGDHINEYYFIIEYDFSDGIHDDVYIKLKSHIPHRHEVLDTKLNTNGFYSKDLGTEKDIDYENY